MLTYYQILGLSSNASQNEIKKAYRQLAKIHHPDLNPNNPIADAKFHQINEAYQTLIEPSKRQLYDDRLAYQRANLQSPSTATAPPPQTRAEIRKEKRAQYTYIEVPDKKQQKLATMGVIGLFLFLLSLPLIALIIDINQNRQEQEQEQALQIIQQEKKLRQETGLQDFSNATNSTYYLSNIYDNHFQLNQQFKEQYHAPLYKALLQDSTKVLNIQCFSPDSEEKNIIACLDIHQKLVKQKINEARIRTFVSNDSLNFVLNGQFYSLIVDILEE